MATNEPTDQDHPHPGQRVNIEELTSRKYSTASNWSTSSSKRPSTASSNDLKMSPTTEGTWKDFTTSETFSNQQGIQVRDFAAAKSGGKTKPKSEVENSRKMLEKSSLV